MGRIFRSLGSGGFLKKSQFLDFLKCNLLSFEPLSELTLFCLRESHSDIFFALVYLIERSVSGNLSKAHNLHILGSYLADSGLSQVS